MTIRAGQLRIDTQWLPARAGHAGIVSHRSSARAGQQNHATHPFAARAGDIYRRNLGSSFDTVAGSRILSERILTVRCAWCRLVIRPGGSRVSDGICPDCLARELAA